MKSSSLLVVGFAVVFSMLGLSAYAADGELVPRGESAAIEEVVQLIKKTVQELSLIHISEPTRPY